MSAYLYVERTKTLLGNHYHGYMVLKMRAWALQLLYLADLLKQGSPCALWPKETLTAVLNDTYTINATFGSDESEWLDGIETSAERIFRSLPSSLIQEAGKKRTR
jgi:hypothetical protein